MMAPALPFPSVAAAIEHWREQPADARKSLAYALEPPVDHIGSDVLDAMLAIWFGKLVKAETVTDRLDLLGTVSRQQQELLLKLGQDMAIAVVEGPEQRELARDAVTLQSALVGVVRKWIDSISDAAAQASVEGRAA